MVIRSDFLFASPSFVEGIARILDFGNTLNVYNYSESEEKADEIAMRLDWAMVGNDLHKAIDDVQKETSNVA
jgi:hypothetical protein